MFKKKLPNHRTHRIFFIISLFFLIIVIIGLTREVANRQTINKKIQSLESEVNKVQTENQDINNLITSGQDSGYLEKEARIKLGLQRPGEKVVVIIKNDSPDNSSAVGIKQEIIDQAMNTAPTDERPNLARWFDYFLKKQ